MLSKLQEIRKAIASGLGMLIGGLGLVHQIPFLPGFMADHHWCRCCGVDTIGYLIPNKPQET